MASLPMPNSSLTATVDSWTAQAVMASGYLMRLYRFLGDDRQTYLAMQASGPCEERAQRLGLQAQINALKAQFVAEHPEETMREEKSWQLMIEAHAGLCALHGLLDDHEQGGSLRGNRTGTIKAFHLALRGYRSAFPEEVTVLGIKQAIETAADKCADVFSLEVDGVTEEEKADLRQELHTNILEALTMEVRS